MSLKGEFIDWKSDPITKALHETIQVRITQVRDILEKSAGLSSDQDNMYRGFILALREVLDFEVEEAEEVETD